MASRVNKKFVIVLSAGLLLAAAGAGGAYYFVQMRSGEHAIAMGDRAMKEGKIDVADKWYERAVGKEQYNVEWLTKWRAAREKKVPPLNEYQSNYQMLQGILRNLAQAQKTNVQAHRDYLNAIHLEASYTGSRGIYEYIAEHVDVVLKFFEADPENPAPAGIRRYRGIALAELASDPNLPKDRVELARQDLEAALKADPLDGEAAHSLAVWHRVMADRARAAGDDAARTIHLERSRAVMQDLLSRTMPAPHATPHPVGLISNLAMEAADVELLNDPGLSPEEVLKKKMAAMDQLAPKVAQVGEQLKAADPALFGSLHVSRFAAIAPRIDPKGGRQVALSLVEHLLKDKPQDMDLLLIRGQLLGMPVAPPEQPTPGETLLAAYQTVIDLPDKPVSFEGMRLLHTRNRARFAQASIAIQRLGDPSLPAEERPKATAEARTKRMELAKYVPDASPDLQFLDAKLAMIDGDLLKARRLLAEFLKKPGDLGEGSVLEGHLLMADIGMKSNPQEPGLAREHLMRVVQARPNNVELRMMLAQVERMLQNNEGAAGIYKSVLQIDPSHEGAAKELRVMKAIMEGGTLDDPVVQVIVNAERASKGTQDQLGDDEKAFRILEKGLEDNNHDPRIAVVLASAKFRLGDREGARQILETAIQKRPDDKAPSMERLQEFVAQLKAADSLEGTVAFIKASTLSPLDKQLALHRAYLEFKKPEEAARALDEAEKLAPDNPRVVDLRFQTALQAQDMAAAGRLADKAARDNLDQADGDTFRARVQIAQKNYREAAATLARTVERGNANAAVYRLLGLVQAELGRTQDAIASFRRALDLVPTDIATIKTFIGMLMNAGETAEALGVARRTEQFGRADSEFLNVWLQLEAERGNAAFARDKREQLRARSPKDSANAASLAELYMDDKKWDKAREVIDALRRESDSLRMAALDARWHADRGAMEPAKQVFRTYIGTLTDTKAKQNAYIAFGQFLMRRGFQQEGLRALNQARDYQDKETMAVDLMLGDIQLNAGIFEDAESSYRRALDAGVKDPTLAIRKRLIESMIQAQKYKEAEAYFVSLGDQAEQDVDLMVQRSSTAKGLGDLAKARAILDRAVTKFPDEPMPYLRRARILLQDPAYTKDAMADLATAIRIRPGFWQALRTRAMFALGEGRTDDGLRDLKEAVERNPAHEDLLLEYLDYLIRFGHENEAVDTAEAALKNRPNDTRLITQFAVSFARGGRWSRAAKFYQMLWLQIQDENSALAYCNALLNSTPPNLAEADAVLANRAIKADRSWRLLLQRAILRKKQGNDAAARQDLLSSFDLIGVDQASLSTWVMDLGIVIPDPNERLKFVSMVRPPAQLEEWMTLIRANIALEDKANTQAATEVLRKLRDASTDNGIRGAVQVSLANANLRDEKWKESLDELILGLQFRPTDAMLSNNAAAVLNEKLGRPQEARPYAERACAADPNNPNYADTLAEIYWAQGDKALAIRKLGDAFRLARTEVDKCRTAMKLARWKIAAGDVAGARALAELIRELMTDNPALRDAIKTEFEAFTKELEGK